MSRVKKFSDPSTANVSRALSMIQLNGLAALWLSLGFVLMAQAQTTARTQPSARITANVDASKLVALGGNVRPEANPGNDRGPVADSLPLEHMQLLLQRSPEQEQVLRSAIDALHDPKSPSFHHWLTAADFGRQYGVAQADIVTITNWLSTQGFKVNTVYPNAMTIDFSGNAGQVRNAFHTQIHQLSVRGTRHIANMGDPQIPAALAPAIKGIVALHDFRPRSMLKRKPQYTAGGSEYDVTPADLATIYNFNPVFAKGITGQGQTIVLIEDTDIYSAQDWTAFRSKLGLSGYTSGSLAQLHPMPSGSANNCIDPGINTADIEAILDAEWASAAAPGATIELASCADTATTFGGLIALQNVLNASAAPPALISISYGECEAYNGAAANASYVSAYQQAVAEGVSVFVSAGDEGAASCDAGQNAARSGITVSGFASTPYNVAVGGTDFGDTLDRSTAAYWSPNNSGAFGSAKSYIPEIPWNDSCAGGLLDQSIASGSVAYGANGVCNIPANALLDSVVAGSGGPSNCAAGNAAIGPSGIVTGLGSCKGAAKPSWQAGVVGLPDDGVRDLPDVSLFASNGFWNHAYIVCYTDTANGGSSCSGAPSGWTRLGGTSVAAPIMAGIQALIDQSSGARQGNPNYVYYKLAATEYGASGNPSCNSSNGNGAGSGCIFYDVRRGDIAVNCIGGSNCFGDTNNLYGVLSTSASTLAPAYQTQIGWDFATGIGTVNVANLVNSWTSP